MAEETEESSGGSTLRNNDKRDHGWYRSANILAHKWTRIVGPQAIAIYHLLKSMCRGNEDITYPEVRQQDWAALLGMGLQPFQRALKPLLDSGLVDRILPQGGDRLLHKPTIYIVNAAEDVPITPELLEKFGVKNFSSDCRFHDPILTPERWATNMFQTTSDTPRTKRIIRDRLNSRRNTPEDITNNMSGDISDNTCLLNRQSNKQTEEILPKGSINGSDEPCDFQNTSSRLNESMNEQDNPIESIHTQPQEKSSFVVVSHYYQEQVPQTAEAEREPVAEAQQAKSSLHSSLADRVRKKNAQDSTGAPRHAKKVDPLPSRESMPRCLQVWFTLPLVTKPSSKTYPRIVHLIRKLGHGKFPAQYHSLNADFTEQFKLTNAHLTRSWSDEDIAKLLEDAIRPMIEDRAYWPENKEKYFKGLSFESFVFNARSGRSWLLSISLRPPHLLREVDTQQTIQHDLYPEATYEVAESLEISRKMNPEQYAGIARNFSRIVQFLQLLPLDEESGGVFRFTRDPKRASLSLAGFLREQYHWVRDAGAGLIGLAGKPIRKWLEEWNDQEIRWPGQKRAHCVLDLLDEYNRHGRIRATSEVVPEEHVSPLQNEMSEEELDVEETKQRIRDQAEHDLERQRRIDNLAPDDLIPLTDEERSAQKGLTSSVRGEGSAGNFQRVAYGF